MFLKNLHFKSYTKKVTFLQKKKQYFLSYIRWLQLSRVLVHKLFLFRQFQNIKHLLFINFKLRSIKKIQAYYWKNMQLSNPKRTKLKKYIVKPYNLIVYNLIMKNILWLIELQLKRINIIKLKNLNIHFKQLFFRKKRNYRKLPKFLPRLLPRQYEQDYRCWYYCKISNYSYSYLFFHSNLLFIHWNFMYVYQWRLLF